VSDLPREMPIIRLKTPQARALTDASAVLQDLRLAIETLQRLQTELAKTKPDDVLSHALWIAGLNIYARCFSQGRRLGLSEELIRTAGEGALDFHQYLLRMRNRHVAHSVNPFEQMVAGVVVDDIATPPVVVGVAVLTVRHLGLEAGDIAQFEQLTRFAQMHVRLLCQGLEGELLKSAKTMDIEQVMRGDRLGVTIPGPNDADVQRDRD